MMKIMNRKGFTLVEIMIVVAIIGLLAAIAIPNFVKARETAQTQACKSNLKQIEGAVQVALLDGAIADQASATLAALVPNYIKRTPTCPANAANVYDPAVSPPTCNNAAPVHVLT